MRRTLPKRLLCCLCFIAMLSVVSGASAQSDSPGALIQLVNEFRAANGLPPLAVNAALMAAAQGHTNWQAATGQHSHTGEGGSTPQGRANAAGYHGTVYENVAGGTLGYVSLTWAMQFWKDSSVHRATMLSRSADIGVGIAENSRDVFFVLVVGSPSTVGPPPTQVTQLPGSQKESTKAKESTATPAQVALVVVPIVIATADAAGSVIHVVQEGQTAWAISARYGISLDELLSLNRLTRSSVLRPGDRVYIKLGEGQSAPAPASTHIVKSGESLWTIAANYGLTLNALLDLNGLKRGAIVKPGDVLRLREATPTAAPSETPAPTLAIATVTRIPPTHTFTPVLPTNTATPEVIAAEVKPPTAAATPLLVVTPTQAPQADGVILVGVVVIAGVGLMTLVMGVAMMTRRQGN